MYEKIRAFCEEKQISARAFERVCDMPNGYILKLEKGMKPSLKYTKVMARVMGISIEELTDEETV